MIIDKTITRFANILRQDCLENLNNHKNIQILRADDFWEHKGRAIYHTKLMIADNEFAIFGGMNFIDADHLSQGTDFNNRDIDLLIKGPVVSDMIRSFSDAWEYFRQKSWIKKRRFDSLKLLQAITNTLKANERIKNIRGVRAYKKNLKNNKRRMNGACRFVTQSPTQSPSRVAKTLLSYLKHTKNYLGIINPMHYDQPKDDEDFEWFNKLFYEIESIIDKGIKTDYITSQVDMAANEFVPIIRERIQQYLKDGDIRWANMEQWEIDYLNSYHAKNLGHYPNLIKNYLSKENVQVWNHISFIHSKVFYLDRLTSSIGSMNFHHNATDQAWEASLFCQDKELNKQLDRIFVLDKLNSIPLIYKNIF